MKTIRWGIIGVGDVTEVKSGPGFQKASNSSLVAVMRRNGALAKDFAERHHVPRWYDDGEALINDPEVDAVYIATPPDSHHHYTRLCANARKPVFVEKPMALSFDECRDMIDVCQAAGVPLWVAYYRRSLPRFLKIKDIIASGELGAVRSVVVKLHQPPPSLEGNAMPWRFNPRVNGGGQFVDMGVHTIDFLDDLFGPITDVRGSAANQAGLYEAEDHVVASFVFESGVMGVGDWCSTTANRTDETCIVGTKGELRFSTFDSAPMTLIAPSGTSTITIENPPHVHQPLIQSIVNELNGVGQCPSTGVTGARTTWFTDQLLRDYKSHLS